MASLDLPSFFIGIHVSIVALGVVALLKTYSFNEALKREINFHKQTRVLLEDSTHKPLRPIA